jgi:hypothetical protein
MDKFTPVFFTVFSFFIEHPFMVQRGREEKKFLSQEPIFSVGMLKLVRG